MFLLSTYDFLIDSFLENIMIFETFFKRLH